VISQNQRRLDGRLPDIDFPYVIQLDRYIDPDPGEPDQLIGWDYAKPSARNHEASTAVDVEPVSDFKALSATSAIELVAS
jgi:hypothetical protein